VESIRTEESEALLTGVRADTHNRLAAARPQNPIVEVPSATAAATEAIAPGIPAEGTVPAIRDRTQADHTLPVRVRLAADLPILLAEVDGPPARAPAAVLVRRVQAARAAAHAGGLSHCSHFLF
jgi:hypothetical protein